MAKRFRFDLEPVLRYRAIMEDKRRREFAEANRLAEAERLRRQELGRERGEVQDDIVRLYEARAPFQGIRDSYFLASRLEGEMADSLKRQRELDQAREQRRRDLVAARRDTRMMETIKENRRAEFVREQDRLDQALLDELSIQARARRGATRRDEGGEV